MASDSAVCDDCAQWNTKHEKAGKAFYADHDGCLGALINQGAEVNSLSLFTAKSDRCLRMLIREGADVNKVTSGGVTPLIFAAKNGFCDSLEALLQAGADVNVQDDEGWTCLMMAGSKRHYKCVELLVKAGADVNLKNAYGSTALALVTHAMTYIVRPPVEYLYKCAKLLIEAGADVNAQDGDGRTALSSAYNFFLYEYADMLIRAGADLCLEQILENCPLYPFMDPWYGGDRLKLLVAAGWDLTGISSQCEWVGRAKYKAEQVRGELIPDPSEIHLSHLCRERIRNHLLEINPRGNLFVRVPRLGLPAALQKYLLYNQTSK